MSRDVSASMKEIATWPRSFLRLPLAKDKTAPRHALFILRIVSR